MNYRAFTRLGGYRHYVTGKDEEGNIDIDMDRRKALIFNSEDEVDSFMEGYDREWHVAESPNGE